MPNDNKRWTVLNYETEFLYLSRDLSPPWRHNLSHHPRNVALWIWRQPSGFFFLNNPRFSSSFNCVARISQLNRNTWRVVMLIERSMQPLFMQRLLLPIHWWILLSIHLWRLLENVIPLQKLKPWPPALSGRCIQICTLVNSYAYAISLLTGVFFFW